MQNRFWDSDGKYSGASLKGYKFWSLEVSFSQHNLGTVIIFSKENVERISQVSKESLLELSLVMREAEEALDKAFKPDRFNYLQLGNALHNLHFHVIPRYSSKREFAGIVWEDKTFGHPPVWSYKEENKDLIVKIKEKILQGSRS